MAISSPGIGSGLDVNSIVSQLVAIEKQPLQVKASKLQAQLSLYGTLKSQVIDLIHRWRAGVLGIGWEVSNLRSLVLHNIVDTIDKTKGIQSVQRADLSHRGHQHVPGQKTVDHQPPGKTAQAPPGQLRISVYITMQGQAESLPNARTTD